MTDKIALAVLGVVALIVVAGLAIGWEGRAVAERLQLLREISIGLIGALGGYQAARSNNNSNGDK